METGADTHTSKVPQVTLWFWIIKIAATTLGETGGDAVTMTMNFGYLAGTAIFALILMIVLFLQIRAARFHALLYWAVIVATTTVGTTLADFVDRSLGIGYTGGSLLLLTLLAASLITWRCTCGAVSTDNITSARTELFYWITILFSQTLGTALGDFLADTTALGYSGSALVFSAALLVVTLAYYFTSLPRAVVFWAAFILTRPLGATVGDFLDKPIVHGGLALSRVSASAALAVFILACILLLPQKPGKGSSH